MGAAGLVDCQKCVESAFFGAHDAGALDFHVYMYAEAATDLLYVLLRADAGRVIERGGDADFLAVDIGYVGDA